MAAPNKLPDGETLKDLRRQGLRLRDIAEQYGVSISAVQYALRKVGGTHKLPDYTTVVPWTVDPSLHTTMIMTYLRAIAKQKAGEALKPVSQRQLNDWFDLLMSNQIVLDYHDEALGWANDACSKGGFFYRTAVPEDKGPNGGGFYREPWINKMLFERQQAAKREHQHH